MRLFGIALLLILFYGCNKEKLKAREAYFIQTGNASVSTSSAQGTSSHKITDIWYYVEGDFKGAFPVGGLLPAPATGPASLRFLAGIKNNGISATRQPYEFYEPFLLDTSVVPGTTVNRNFIFNYKPNVKFHLIEGFEGTGFYSISKNIDSDTTYSIISDPAQVFEGQKCAYIALTDDRSYFNLISTNTYSLPLAGAPVYMELNYKCNQPFEVGVYSGFSFKRVLTVNTSEEWNKIYIQLSSGVSSNPTSAKQGFYFKSVKSTDSPAIYLDNIKLLSY